MRPWEWTKKLIFKGKRILFGGRVGQIMAGNLLQKWWKQRRFCKTYSRTATLQYPLMAISLCIFNSGDPLPSSFLNFLFNFPLVPAANTLRADWMEQLPDTPPGWTEPSSLCSTRPWTETFPQQASTASHWSPEFTEGIFHSGFSWTGNRKARVKTPTNQTNLHLQKETQSNLIWYYR